MRWARGASAAASLMGLVSRQDPPADSTVVTDAETGFKFSEYATERGITFRIARPDPAPATGDFPLVLQVAAPVSMGWVGMAWGGSMTYNPLAIAWENGTTPVVSSRFAYGYYVPPAYEGATYTKLAKGTHVNATHWQYTVLCTGCGYWGDEDLGYTQLTPTGQNALAYAYSANPVDEPANNASTFNIHDGVGHWYHDFGAAGNTGFQALVAKNSGTATTPTTGTPTPTTPQGPKVPFPSSCANVSAFKYNYTLASGWKIAKLAGGLSKPRTVIFDPQGNMLVLQASLGISVHTFGPNGCINSSTTVVSNRNLNHGLTLTPDGKTLYASSISTAWRWDWDGVNRKISTNSTVVIKGMSPSGHSTRTLVVVPSKPNLVLAQVGSNANWDYPSGSPATGRAAVKVFDMSAVPAGGYDYNTAGYQFGYGMRNEIGLVFDPSGNVWGVENSGDDFQRTVNNKATDIHNDNPAEELNFLGDPTKPNNQWYGYPTCFSVWDPSLITDAKFSTGQQFVVTPNATFTDSNCNQKSMAPRLSFQAHSAPITAAFDAGAANMYVSFHGSWDRPVPTGFKLVEIPFTKSSGNSTMAYEPVAKSDARDGYKDILSNKDITKCSAQCFRPAAVAFDPSGRLIVSSDATAEGELFVLVKA